MLRRFEFALIDDLGIDHVQRDVCAHLLDDFLARETLTVVSVEVVFIYDFLQFRSRHHALAYGLDALRSVAGDRRLNQLRRNILLFDQEGGRGLVSSRPEPGRQRTDQENRYRDQNDAQTASLESS